MLEEEKRANRRKIFVGRMFFLLYVGLFSCVIFIPLAFVFVKAAGAAGLAALLASLALWVGLLALVLYFNADIVRRATGARPLEDGLHPRLGSAAEDIAIVSGQEIPLLMLVPDRAANAFSIVSFRRMRPMVFCTEGMAGRLDVDEIRAVMAHEMAHLRNGDTDIGSMILPFSALAPALYQPFMDLSIRSVTRKRLMALIFTGLLLGLFLALPVALLVYVIYKAAVPVVTSEIVAVILLALAIPFASLYFLSTLVSLYWRFTLGRREFLADETAVGWTNYPEGMIDALRKTGEKGTGSSLAFLDDSCFGPPLGVRSLLDFQPSLIDRIENLRRETYLPPA